VDIVKVKRGYFVLTLDRVKRFVQLKQSGTVHAVTLQRVKQMACCAHNKHFSEYFDDAARMRVLQEKGVLFKRKRDAKRAADLAMSPGWWRSDDDD
jgi:hypothetical protein